jgi:hypothetical protein
MIGSTTIRLLIAASLQVFTSAVFGQPQGQIAAGAVSRPEIRGSVTEFGTMQPIAGVEVNLWPPPTPGSPNAGVAKPLESSTTSATGAFRFSPETFGSYRVEVKKNGYTAARSPFKGSTTTASVNLTSDHPIREIELVLAQPGRISGTLVDEESGNPIAGMKVSYLEVAYRNGTRMTIGGGQAVTDAEGRFVAASVTPGDYVVFAVPRLSDSRLVHETSKEALDAVDTDYRGIFWPNGTDMDTAPTVTIGSGTVTNLGQWAMHKVPLYRVRVSVPSGSCGSLGTVNVHISGDVPGWITSIGKQQCGTPFLLRGFPSGSYRLEAAVPEPSRTNRVRGSLTFHVANRNLDVVLSLASGVDVTGKVLGEAGAKTPSVDGVTVAMRPPTGLPEEDNVPLKPDAEGNFRLVNAELREQLIQIGGLARGYYIKEIRYNGSTVRGNVISLIGHAMQQSLEIVIGENPAAVAGVVKDGDRAADHPYVVLAQMPLDNSPFAIVPATTGDEDGKFQFNDVAPGDYRILAVAANSRERLQEPFVLERTLATSKKIALGKGAFQSITVELTELR